MICERHIVHAGGHDATVFTYLLDNAHGVDHHCKRPMVIICPGGGYVYTSDREAEPIAVQMNALGFHAVVLRYSVKPVAYPTALLQLASTVELVRQCSEEWCTDPNKIIVMGFSAGGHLAASLGTLWNKGVLEAELGHPAETYRPDGLVLCYPVITSGLFAHEGSMSALLADNQQLRPELSLDTRVDSHTPPCFLWHTFEDNAVPVENCILFAQALRRHDVPFEMHIFQYGQHGLATATSETSVDQSLPNVKNWISMVGEWIPALF